MPRLTYQGEEGRYYPSLALTPNPGTTYDLDADPCDGRWTPATDAGAWTMQPGFEPGVAAPVEAEPHDTTGGE
ncbi:hypothetical protein ABZW30_12400 [Kitasatospora sp. NPDC004669]|uniref:hypothetical protein n=1 Tax=Kitasatospora sp. NPDC004669 TaxID=3154555 RepID=UPI0033AE0FFE